MDTHSKYFLGIDVGGTHVKIGRVKTDGEIVDFHKEITANLRSSDVGFNLSFLDIVGKYLKMYGDIDHVGIGLPGLTSKDRNTTLEIPAIKELNGFDLRTQLEKRYAGITFHLENDANAAAAGEYYFGKEKTPESFLFITLGTGIGSALILEGKVFKGARGNAMEMGHMLSRNNIRLEVLIGRNGILKILANNMEKYPDQKGRFAEEELGMHLLVACAGEGNKVAMETFKEVGEILGEALVSTIRVLDVTQVYFGGGISAGLPFIQPSMEKVIHKHLSSYYVQALHIQRASLENNAGLLGAAALCFMD
ncbi:ROK family protein [Pleomorphovibrio marinus]|uniref:ROK family protein n=1 Tax=Pleomorphovibrio marinus TaxID=2164132 RepID=UPI000E0A5B65|nr:ROK family protein [Pleomorphovibrio marinus]